MVLVPLHATPLHLWPGLPALVTLLGPWAGQAKGLALGRPGGGPSAWGRKQRL